MAVTTAIRTGLNRLLAPLNVEIGTTAARRAKTAWLQALTDRGQFSGPVLPVLPQFPACDPAPVFEGLKTYAAELARFDRPLGDHFSLRNNYFTSPDAEVAYVMIRRFAPRRILEVGSGNSTFLFRAALDDAKSDAELVSIDPYPRRAIEAASGRIVRMPCEELSLGEFTALEANDILFIDSSHDVKTGNDVIRLFLEVLPQLKPGVVVHVHDIRLPYDYPAHWARDFGWAEQYLLQALLQGSGEFEVLWPGYYLQRSRTDFLSHFPLNTGGDSLSFWMRKAT